MGPRTIAHRFYVMETEALDFVLVTDFFVQHTQIQSLTLQAPYLLYVDHGDGREFVSLEQSESTSSYLSVSKEEPSNMMVASKAEDYQLLGEVLDQGLKELVYSREDLSVELFASDKQYLLDFYCNKGKNCCYKFYWPSFGMAYGNPRFSELEKVVTKVALERSRMVLCLLYWAAHRGNEYWRILLGRLTITSVELPDEAIHVPLGRKTPIRKPGLGSGCPSGNPRVPFACVCARTPAASAPSPLGGVACAPRVVPALGAGRAVPRGPCPSACPAPVPCSVWRCLGGGVGSRFPPTWLGLHALWGLRAARVVGGHPRGGWACHCCEGRLVSGAVPPPTAHHPGQAAGVSRPVCSGCGRCGRGDPAPAPQRAPLRAGVARCGGGGRASPGGGAFHRCEGRLRSGAPPPPTARPLGELLGSATHVMWARVCGCGGRTLSLWPACPVGAACRGGEGGPSPGGMACHRCEGRLVSGAVPPPAAHPPGQAAGVSRPVCPGCGWCGRGDPAPAPQLAPWRAGVARREGGGRASPGGPPSTVVRGV